MKKLLMFLCCVFAINTANAVDIAGIINPNNWQQVYHSQTYTIGADGQTLFYRGQSTGMRLPAPQQAGSQITVTDPNIAPRPGPTPRPNPNPNPTPNPVPKPSIATTAVQLGSGLVLQDQGYEGIVAANAPSEEKKTWKEFWSSTGSGALAGAGTAGAAAAIVNVIPVGGQVAWGVATSAGAVVGAVGGAILTGKRIFSETDCEKDPVIDKYVCCNISNLSKIDAIRVGIGGEMFAEFPFVRTCVQGKKEYTTEQPWLKGRFMDDHWSEEGKVKLCSGYEMPDAAGEFRIQLYGDSESEGTVCWKWECADNGYKRQGNLCINGNNSITPREKDCTNTGGVWHGVGEGEFGPEFCDCKPAGKKLSGTKCVAETKNCRDVRTTDAGKACCDTPYANNWNEKTQTCTCGANERFEIYNTNHGRCVKISNNNAGNNNGAGNSQSSDNGQPSGNDGGSAAPAYNCVLDKFADWRSLYKDCPDVIAALDELELYCVSSARTEEGYTTRYTKLQQLRRACEQKANDRKVRITESTGIISDASKELDRLMANLKVTVWKNAEGKFNTARLASDSIAGVVLGTAGGLITSHVVKKNQVKKGFEDIQCTVGGQKVADWGDEFTVGIR